jgi:fimbrial isopeptide formation D2 family protein
VDGAGNTIADPTVAGDGATAAQTLTWNLADATADIDVAEGATVTVTYEVLVLENALARQNLTNSVNAQWTSIDGDSIYERNGTATPAVNDYFATAATTLTTPDVAVSKTRLTDTYGAADANVRIGDIVQYELRLSLPEGTIPNLVITDTLPQGLVYESVLSVNGETIAPYPQVAPFSHIDIAAPLVSGDPATGPTTVSFTVGEVINAGDNDATNNDFVIVYYARSRRTTWEGAARSAKPPAIP